MAEQGGDERQMVVFDLSGEAYGVNIEPCARSSACRR